MKQHVIIIEHFEGDSPFDISLSIEDQETKDLELLETHEILNINSVTHAYRLIDSYRDRYDIFKIIEIVRDEYGSKIISENIETLIEEK